MRCNQPPLVRQATLDPARDAVAAALALATDFAIDAGCDEDMASRLAILIEELIANIVEHGDVPQGAAIGLRVSALADAVRVEIKDPGRFHDPRTHLDTSDLPPERGGGAGIRLVLAWSRIRDYRRVDGSNILTLDIDWAANAGN